MKPGKIKPIGYPVKDEATAVMCASSMRGKGQLIAAALNRDETRRPADYGAEVEAAMIEAMKRTPDSATGALLAKRTRARKGRR